MTFSNYRVIFEIIICFLMTGGCIHDISSKQPNLYVCLQKVNRVFDFKFFSEKFLVSHIHIWYILISYIHICIYIYHVSFFSSLIIMITIFLMTFYDCSYNICTLAIAYQHVLPTQELSFFKL